MYYVRIEFGYIYIYIVLCYIYNIYKWMAWSWVLVWRRRDHLSGGWDASESDRYVDGVAAGFGHGPSVITSDIYCNQVEEKPLKSHLSDPSRHHDLQIITGTHRWPGSPGHSPPCWGAVEFGGRPGITALPGWSLGELMPNSGGFSWDFVATEVYDEA